MRAIWKYTLPSPETRCLIPEGFTVVHFAFQGNVPTVWVNVNTENDNETVDFQIIGTGQPIRHNLTHAGSCLHGEFVWHLFY